MSLILGVCASGHDASACLYDDYDLLAAVPLERITRIKSEGARFPVEAIREVLEIAGVTPDQVDTVCTSRSYYPLGWYDYSHSPLVHRLRRTIEVATGSQRQSAIAKEARLAKQPDVSKVFRNERLLTAAGLRPDTKVVFFDHHFGHSLPALFHNPDWNDALLYTSDGGAETGYYSFRWFHDGQIDTLFGGDEMLFAPHPVSSLALAYGFATLSLGYKINRHEGKLTGLAARGNPTGYDALRGRFHVAENGQITCDFESNAALKQAIFDYAEGSKPEDVSATVQKLVEDVTLDSVTRLVEKHPTRNLGLAGGLFANVRVNQILADSGLFDTVFIVPPMSDQGIALGGVLQHLLARDGLPAWLEKRRPLDNVYFGRDYTDIVDEEFTATPEIRSEEKPPVEAAVDAIIAGEAVAIYTGRMEFGPRALGTRTVMAATIDAEINDSLNARMDRSEFMPFAPVILEEHADEVLILPSHSRYAARFMTITCQVREEWIERIPAVVHVDGTARPQIIRREDNPLYYDILSAYHQRTGIPVLVNTSFNVHEEPIINSPAECAQALIDNRVDAVVTTNGFYRGGN